TALFAGSVEREIPLVSLFDVQNNSRNFPLLAQAQILKQMARRGGSRGGAQGGAGAGGSTQGGRGVVPAGAGGGAQTAARQPADQADQADPMDGDAGGTPPRRGAPDPQRAALLQQLGEAYLRAPERYPTANVLAHEELVPDSYILSRGDFKKKGEKVEPGFLSALNPGLAIDEPKGVLFVPQRRKALALWLTSPDQPLLARVMVNRIWQGHFGQGIGRTPNDFGRQ